MFCPYHIRITFTDIDGNKYSQEFSKVQHGYPKHTEPIEIT